MPKPNLLSKNLKEQFSSSRKLTNGETAAIRIKNVLRDQSLSIKQSILDIHRIVKRSGRQEVEDALGENRGELEELYNALKIAAEILGIDDIPNLPE